MNWERDPLWAKARLFFERAFEEGADGPFFGLWCSLGLELLARAALASVSPTLLAEPDREHKNLLHVLGRGSAKAPPKSLGTADVLRLCRLLFAEFTDEDLTASMALINRRNDELHSGAAAFEEYPARQWLTGFYRACRSLAAAMDESLADLLGEEEAQAAAAVLTEAREGVVQKVRSSIAAHQRVFAAKPAEVREAEAERTEQEGAELASKRHHRVECPACGCTATVQGDAVGRERTTHAEGMIEVRRSMSPKSFGCSACGLQLNGYAELEAADLGGYYTRITTFSPEEFYGLVDLETYDVAELVNQYLRDHPEFFHEYDNE